MKISFFGSSLLSAYWNGAATYYRGIVRALHQRGHRITFYEPDAYQRQQHRDLGPPDWAEVVVYENKPEAALQQLESAKYADMVVKASGIGVFDELLEAAVLEEKRPYQYIIFWDVDAPTTLERMKQNPVDPFRKLIPEYDFILTYGGGPPVCAPEGGHWRATVAGVRRVGGGQVPDRRVRRDGQQVALAPRL